MNRMVNEQAEVQLLIQAPLLMGYLLALRLLVPLFYDIELMVAVPMTQLAMFGMFIRTMTYPMSYMPLARGDSKVFILQEAIYDIIYVVSIIIGYKFFGLSGVGVAVAVVYFFEWLLVSLIAFIKYRFILSKQLVKCFLLQLPVFLLMLFVTQTVGDGVEYWAYGTIVTLLSAILSLYLLSKRLSLVKQLLTRVKRIMK